MTSSRESPRPEPQQRHPHERRAGQIERLSGLRLGDRARFAEAVAGQTGEVDFGEGQRHRSGDPLHRPPALPDDRRAQSFVPVEQEAEGAGEDLGIEPPGNAPAGGDVQAWIAGSQLVEQPEPRLAVGAAGREGVAAVNLAGHGRRFLGEMPHPARPHA
ncbi:hypothetical protein M2440_001850 [Methylorubrum extorquens]|nr:hypothetical protein [Methylorubrum extorquens]